MYRKLLLAALIGLGFTACKKTERVEPVEQAAPAAAQTGQQAGDDVPAADAGGTGTQKAPDTPPAPDIPPAPAAPEAPSTPEAPADPAAQEDPAAQPPAETPAQPAQESPAAEADLSSCLMEVCTKTQGFDPMSPWKRDDKTGAHRQSAVYLGDGRVLVCSAPLRAATIVELRLPDGSRTVPANVLKCDDELGLGLLTVAHEEDMSVFDSRKACTVGGPLALKDKAELWCLIGGVIPCRVDLSAESASANGRMPRINLKSGSSISGDAFANGAPVIRNGELVGITQGYDAAKQVLSCINAEVIQRFLEEDSGAAAAGAPTLGIGYESLKDPVFLKYLGLDQSATGLYITKVRAGSPAAQAGLCVGDVVTAISGMEIDRGGRCEHPLYGMLDASSVITSCKALEPAVTFTVLREGKPVEITVAMDREASAGEIIGTVKPGEQPRYILRGGLLFLPLTEEYLQAVRNVAGGLPVPYLEAIQRDDALREKGVTEVVTLAYCITTPASFGYENVACCVVEKVNGTVIHNFDEFVHALDTPTADGMAEITLTGPPYTIHLDCHLADVADSGLLRSGIHHLRYTGPEKKSDK